MGVKNLITLPTNHNVPASDLRYLKLQPACAQVAHLSGAAEYTDGVERDIEETRVPANDGSSSLSDLLYFKLSSLTAG